MASQFRFSQETLQTVLIAPLKFLLTVAAYTLTPAYWALQYLFLAIGWLAGLGYSLVLLPYVIFLKFETIIIFLASAIALGIAAGLWIHFASNGLISLVGLQRSQSVAEPAHGRRQPGREAAARISQRQDQRKRRQAQLEAEQRLIAQTYLKREPLESSGMSYPALLAKEFSGRA